MAHKVLPYENQLHIPLSENGPEPTAIELRFPSTFSRKAQRVLRYYDGCIFLFAWNGKFVMTDELLQLDDAFEHCSCPRCWQGDNLDKLETWLEAIADANDEKQPQGWVATRMDGEDDRRYRTSGRVIGDLSGAVLVKMQMDTNFMIISTVDRRHGRQGRFFVSPALLEPLLRNNTGSATDVDGANFASFCRWEQNITITFTWLNMLDNEVVNGFRQIVEVPVDLLRRVFYGHETVQYLYLPTALAAKVNVGESSYTQKVIHRVINGDKRIRRAFSKAMRDCFQWRGDEITLYGDGRYDFFFRTASGFPSAGGLILHETERNGHHCYYFSVHT